MSNHLWDTSWFPTKLRPRFSYRPGSIQRATKEYSAAEFLKRLLGPVDPSFRALSGRLKFTVRRHKFNKDFLSLTVRGRALPRVWFRGYASDVMNSITIHSPSGGASPPPALPRPWSGSGLRCGVYSRAEM